MSRKFSLQSNSQLPVIDTRPNITAPFRNPLWDLYRDGVTQGLICRFLSCPERHRLAMVEGLSQYRTGGPMAFGSVIHDALHQICGAWMSDAAAQRKPSIGRALRRLPRALAKMQRRDKHNLDQMPATTGQEYQELDLNYAMAEIVLKHYFERWRRDFGSVQWMSLEEEFDVPYDPRIRLGLDRPIIRTRGKRDGQYRTRNRPDIWLFETKTKARIEQEEIVSKIHFDVQVMTYLHSIAWDYQRRPRGVMYNVIRRPQLRWTAKETLEDYLHRIDEDIRRQPDFYFVRFQCAITEREMKLWAQEFDNIMRRIIEWWDDPSIRNYRDCTSCVTKFGRCEYLRICSSHGSDLRFYQRRATPFPELESGAEADELGMLP